MINFKQFIDLLTLNGKYHWFILPRDYIQFLSTEETSLLHIEDDILCDSDVICFYPKGSQLIGLSKEGLMIALNKAITKEDFELVKLIKERLKEINENNNKT